MVFRLKCQPFQQQRHLAISFISFKIKPDATSIGFTTKNRILTPFWYQNCKNCKVIKFGFSEKTTKFEKIFVLLYSRNLYIKNLALIHKKFSVYLYDKTNTCKGSKCFRISTYVHCSAFISLALETPLRMVVLAISGFLLLQSNCI